MKKFRDYYERFLLRFLSKKPIRVMKLSLFLSILTISQLWATETYSQMTKLTLKLEDAKISDVLREIENQSEFFFLYSPKLIDVERKVNIDAKEETIKDILSNLFDEKVKFAVYDRQVILTPNEKSEILSSFQQQNKITGTVTDKNGPIPGANIVVTGTTLGAITDFEGKYSIDVPPGSKSLTFSFIGMEPQEITIGTLTQINVTMAESAIGLEEVVVIGYGTQKKVNVIGSVATITNKELNFSPVSNVSNAIAGRLPGAIAVQNTGEPGLNDAQILIRGSATLGNNSPLIVVDGVADRDLNSIESNDIESLTILKDASAAIYGARAANGVILITTKRGIEGAPKLTYDFHYGWSTPTMLPKMVDAATHAELVREDQIYLGVSEANMRFSQDDIQKFRSNEYPWTYPNTNWFNATLAKYSNTYNQALSASGGTKNVNYYVSFGNHFDGGIYKNSGTSYKRYNLNANIDIKINDYLTIGLDLNGSQENRMYGTQSSETIFESIVRSEPTMPAVYPNGLPGPDIEYGWNPVVTSSFKTGFNDDKRYKSQNKITATLKVPKVDGLSVSTYYAYDMFFGINKYFIKPWTLYQLDEAAYLAAGNTGKEDGSAFLIPSSKGTSEPQLTDTYIDSKTTTFNIRANYEKTINIDHNISAFIAYENSEYLSKSDMAFRRYFISDKLPYLFAGGSLEQRNDGSVSIDSRINYFGRLSYNYKETYLFQFTLRRDGSLRFSEESGRWGNFPGVLLGWRVSNEKFWQKRVSFVDYFKLKASWGQLGNDRVNAFQYLSSYAFGPGMVIGSGKTYFSSLSQSFAPNPFITWEVANIYNAGFESKFLNNEVELNADFFYQRRDHILVKRNASVPDYIGISLPDENFGIVDNKGVEIVLGYTKKVGGLLASIRSNFSFARNKIIEFDEPAVSVPWQRLTGHPQGTVLLYRTLGIFHDTEEILSYPHLAGTRPGDLKIEDFDGNGQITSDDRVLVDKTNTPEITYGESLSLSYKNWNLSALIYGVANVMKRKDGGEYADYVLGRWTQDNPTSNIPRTSFGLPVGYEVNSYLNDFEYQNASYARLKNLQLSLTVPKNFLKSIWLKDAMMYVSGENLFLLSKRITPNDPELGQKSNQYPNYPLMKVYTFGIKVTF